MRTVMKLMSLHRSGVIRQFNQTLIHKNNSQVIVRLKSVTGVAQKGSTLLLNNSVNSNDQTSSVHWLCKTLLVSSFFIQST